MARALAGADSGEAVPRQPPLVVFMPGRQIRPRTPGQARYLEAIAQNDVVLCQGPAGTGKTYLAVAAAVAALRAERIRKLVLVRPAVEAGESLGFLPGDLQAKINPYLRPLMDALHEMMDHELIQRYTEQDLIEVIPLAYMRGRTLNEAFIILDEAQNTTVAQMKMFLTRMGVGSKIVVSGDTTQIDLPPHTRSGLVDALERLHGHRGDCRGETGPRPTSSAIRWSSGSSMPTSTGRSASGHRIELTREPSAAGGTRSAERAASEGVPDTLTDHGQRRSTTYTIGARGGLEMPRGRGSGRGSVSAAATCWGGSGWPLWRRRPSA